MNLRSRVLAYTAMVGLGLTLVGCPVEPRGPISVEEIVSPSTIQSGSSAEFKIKVTNNGAKVIIDKVNLYEEITGGWARGVNATKDFPLSNNEVPAHSTTTVVDGYFTGYNIPPYGTPSNMADVTLKDTITVNSDGGNATCTATYTILH